MAPRRRTQASVRRQAESELIDEYLRETPTYSPKPVAGSAETAATPCPYDPPDTEDTLA